MKGKKQTPKNIQNQQTTSLSNNISPRNSPTRNSSLRSPSPSNPSPKNLSPRSPSRSPSPKKSTSRNSSPTTTSATTSPSKTFPKKGFKKEEPKYDKTQWQGRIRKIDDKGNQYIDNQRLVFEAQKAACTPNMTAEELQEIMDQIDEQIALANDFKEQVSKSVVQYNDELKLLKDDEANLAKKENDKRKLYLKLHKENSVKGSIKKTNPIEDVEDYNIAIQILETEVQKAEADVNFLSQFLPKNPDESIEEESEIEPPQQFADEDESEIQKPRQKLLDFHLEEDV